MTGESDNRLRWRCRRGMLELDALLLAFLEAGRLDDPDRLAFSRLLDREDIDLYHWLTGQEAPPEDLRALVERMRTHTARPT